MRQIFFADTDAIVCDRQIHLVRAFLRTDPNTAACATIFDGIADEVHKELCHEALITGKHQIFRHLIIQADALHLSNTGQFLTHGINHVVQTDSIPFEMDPSFITTREHEQL